MSYNLAMIQDVVREARDYALVEIGKYGLPGKIHFEITEKKGKELAKQLNANEEVVQLGVYFMDLRLGQAFSENKLTDHVAMSAEAAKEFFRQHPIDKSFEDKVINCIEAHHGAVPFKCIEAEICANADCYRFIHPAGFFFYLTALGKRKGDFLKNLQAVEAKLEEKHKILSLNICKQELESFYQTLKQYIQAARNLYV